MNESTRRRATLVGRADLVRLAAARTDGGERLAALEVSARCVGYRLREPQTKEVVDGRGPGSTSVAARVSPAVDGEADELIPFWQPHLFDWRGGKVEQEQRKAVSASEAALEADARVIQRKALISPPRAPPLTSRARLMPLLGKVLTATLEGPELDIDALVRCWSRGECVARLPLRACRTWPQLVVIVDASPDLAPIWEDMRDLLRLLVGRLGREAVQIHALEPGDEPELLIASLSAATDRPVLALTDLGWYSDSERRRSWLRLGRWLAKQGRPRCTVVPVPRDRWTLALERAWSPIEWERPTGARPSDEEREARAERLIDIVAQVRRLEPGLLRALRLLIPRCEADVETEMDAWLHPEMASRCPSATVVRSSPERAELRKRRFSSEPEGLRARVFELVYAWHWHRGYQPELWYIDALGLWDPSTDAGGELIQEELGRAERFFVRLSEELREPSAQELAPQQADAIGSWLGYVRDFGAGFPTTRTRTGRALQVMWGATRPADELPPNPDLALLELGRGGRPTALVRRAVVQVGDSLICTHDDAQSNLEKRRFSPVGHIWAHEARALHVSPSPVHAAVEGTQSVLQSGAIDRVAKIRTPRSTLSLRPLTKPAWARAIGRDGSGLWAELFVKGVAYRMRWIPPGRFVMGSPEDEPGRYREEGPQHEVTITRGFWLGETPVTQALWEAVMGENPSRFKTPDRPVEQVSWEECQGEGGLMERLNRAIEPEDDAEDDAKEDDPERFRLPTEAEWEYACRAGTRTATYAGPIEILGAWNAPVLDGIAWYGGNSGVEYDLDDGVDSSEWPDKQHEHSRAGTRRVAQKLANAWGLHDMLGNVWEWCMDRWDGSSVYASEPQRDPSGASTGEGRVIRGGSWVSVAGYVRAACRGASDPGNRDGHLGLRLARGQSGRTQGARRAGPGGPDPEGPESPEGQERG